MRRRSVWTTRRGSPRALLRETPSRTARRDGGDTYGPTGPAGAPGRHRHRTGRRRCGSDASRRRASVAPGRVLSRCPDGSGPRSSPRLARRWRSPFARRASCRRQANGGAPSRARRGRGSVPQPVEAPPRGRAGECRSAGSLSPSPYLKCARDPRPRRSAPIGRFAGAGTASPGEAGERGEGETRLLARGSRARSLASRCRAAARHGKPRGPRVLGGTSRRSRSWQRAGAARPRRSTATDPRRTVPGCSRAARGR